MAQKSISQFLQFFNVIYRVGFSDFNNTMVLSSKKSYSTIVLSPKSATFDKKLAIFAPWCYFRIFTLLDHFYVEV